MTGRGGIIVAVVITAFAALLVAAGRLGETRWTSRPDSPSGPAAPARVVGGDVDGRLVEHMLGRTRVPLRPQRIVSLTIATTDALLALGVQPVGAEAQWRDDTSITPHRRALAGVPSLGFGSSLNLEDVARLEPDLILCGRTGHARLYDKLSRIAPTVFLPVDLDGRNGGLREVGEILGRVEAAEHRLEAHRQTIAAARDRLVRVAGQTVAVLRIRFRDVMIFNRHAKFGPLLFSDEGLRLRPDARVPERTRGTWADSLDIESLSEVRADRLFLLVDPDAAGSARSLFRTDCWRSLPAVRSGRLHVVDFGTWMNGQGVLAAEAMIDEVVAFCVGRPGTGGP